MPNYIFIETRDPFSSTDTRFIADIAIALRQNGHQVIVFFVQNAVLALRKTVTSPSTPLLIKAGIELLADDFSLSERGIRSDELSDGVRPENIETLVDLLVEDDTKALWH
jgi:predicted peroxiredoxin